MLSDCLCLHWRNIWNFPVLDSCFKNPALLFRIIKRHKRDRCSRIRKIKIRQKSFKCHAQIFSSWLLFLENEATTSSNEHLCDFDFCPSFFGDWNQTWFIWPEFKWQGAIFALLQRLGSFYEFHQEWIQFNQNWMGQSNFSLLFQRNLAFVWRN